jgi:hypothetical protein
MLKLPKQKDLKEIHYDNETYRIIFKKNVDFFGETDPGKKIITIRDGLPPRLLLATLVHEILHVIEFEYPVKIKHKVIHKLEEGLVEILLDNFL